MWSFFFMIVVTTRIYFPAQATPDTITIEDGLIGSSAERAHFTSTRFGYMDPRGRDEDWMIEIYNKAELDHEVIAHSYTPEKWEELEEKIPDVGELICTKYLDEPVFKENNIELNDEELDSISLVRKNLVFLHYQKLPQSLIFVQCPVKMQGVGGSYVYTTPFEEIKKQQVDYYFILVDLFYEDIEDGTGEVVVVMGSRLGSRVPIVERFQKMLNKVLNFIK